MSPKRATKNHAQRAARQDSAANTAAKAGNRGATAAGKGTAGKGTAGKGTAGKGAGRRFSKTATGARGFDAARRGAKGISPSGRSVAGSVVHKRTGRIRSKTPVPSGDGSSIRLQKFLASAGVGSRRECEVLIVEGRIEVDDKVVTELGTRIDAETNEVCFDGERVRLERLQYFMLNKPPGVVCTAQDPSGRTRVVDLISSHQRVYNVGRLDKSSEGLILVTNDGPLAQYLTHPSFGIEKIYHVVVKGSPHTDDLNILKKGVHLMEGIAKVKDVQVRKRQTHATELQITLDEGKNREIRRMLAKLGHKVVRLVRVAIGPLALGNLQQGAHRRLTSEEIVTLKDWAERAAKGQTLKTVVKPIKERDAKRAERPMTDAKAANPIHKKIAEGRPVHFEDVQKSKDMRTAEREAKIPKGKRKQIEEREVTKGSFRPNTSAGRSKAIAERGSAQPKTPGRGRAPVIKKTSSSRSRKAAPGPAVNADRKRGPSSGRR